MFRLRIHAYLLLASCLPNISKAGQAWTALPVENSRIIRRIEAAKRPIGNSWEYLYNPLAESPAWQEHFAIIKKGTSASKHAVSVPHGGRLLRIAITDTSKGMPIKWWQYKEKQEDPRIYSGDIAVLQAGISRVPMIVYRNGRFPTWRSGKTTFFYYPYEPILRADGTAIIFGGFAKNSFPPRITHKLFNALYRDQDYDEFDANSKIFKKGYLASGLRNAYADFYLPSETWNSSPQLVILRKRIDPKVEYILERLVRLRKTKRCPSAFAAMDHFFHGDGAFQEIPGSFAMKVRSNWEAEHKKKALSIIRTSKKNDDGKPSTKAKQFTQSPIRDELAMKAIWPSRSINPLNWRKNVSMQFEWVDGTTEGYTVCENVEYFGPTIHSTITIDATIVPGTRCYIVQLRKWKSYVVDNYDWEGDKQFGFGFGESNSLTAVSRKVFNILFPSQQEMNSLVTKGYAKPYQRSSRSWEVNISSLPEGDRSWKECFNGFGALDFRDMAQTRADRREFRKFANQLERKRGALPLPPPAENTSKKLSNSS